MSSIIQTLNQIQEREGWLSETSLRHAAEELGLPLHRLESVSTFYTHFRRIKPKATVVQCCRDLACMMRGGEQAAAALKDKLSANDDVEIEYVSCIGRCDTAPAATIGHDVIQLKDIDQLAKDISDGQVSSSSSVVKIQSKRHSIAEQWAADIYGSESDRYGTLRQVLQGDIEKSTLIKRLKDSGLKGMGGAGFPTGLKWELVSKESITPKHVICNADESEPGTFKDRAVLSDIPHLVIEGMILGAWTIGAERATVFIRHEYEPERKRLQAAIEAAYACGALGKNIFDSGFDLELDIFISPGGYILGEETALLECMEDKRGEPRNKPPFPGSHGLWGKPTLINNVESFAHAVGIINKGIDWWNDLGKEGFVGHKFISVSGDVAEPGVHLIPVGTTLGELLDLCGGMKDGAKLQAIAPGGASSNFLGPEAIEIPMDFKPLADAGSMLGSGATVFVAEGHDLIEVGLNVTRFFRNESCGKCVPCRVGAEKAVLHLEKLTTVAEGDVVLLAELNDMMSQMSICGLGQVALGPMMSILNNFPRS